jgi:hypothetical protein
VLCLTLKRSAFDWETGRQQRIDDTVEFPLQYLDMSPYLDAPPPDGSAPAARHSSAPHDDFGRGGAQVLARGHSALVLGALDYELYAVMVQEGARDGMLTEGGAGHYYCLLKDFATGEWAKYDDDRVTPADEADLREVFGGAGASSSWLGSTVAYMVLYRRIDAAVNIDAIDHVSPELRAEYAAYDAVRAARARDKADQAAALQRRFPLAVTCGGGTLPPLAFDLDCEEDDAWAACTAQIAEAIAAAAACNEEAGSAAVPVEELAAQLQAILPPPSLSVAWGCLLPHRIALLGGLSDGCWFV